MQAEYRKLRSAAHADERAQFERLARDPTFRHFLALCISERAASDVGPVEISSADPETWSTLAAHWLRRLSHGRVDYRLQFDEGDDVVEMIRFWTVAARRRPRPDPAAALVSRASARRGAGAQPRARCGHRAKQ